MLPVTFDGLNGPKMSILTHWKGSLGTGIGTNFVFITVCGLSLLLHGNILQETDNALLTGNHMGIHRILAKTRLRYCWPTLNFYVINWVKSCEPCSKRERPQSVIKTKLE
jgi:hypothetical protein